MKRLDIANQIIDLGARQRQIRHRTMRMLQERAQLVGRHSAARDRLERGRTLRHGARWVGTDHVAIGAPLASDLRALGTVGKDRVSALRGENQ